MHLVDAIGIAINKRTMPRKAAFFFGSGISLASYPPGAASVGGITDSVFNAEWHFTTAKTFAFGKNPNPLIPDGVTPAVKEFLLCVKNCADEYIKALAKGRAPRLAHYEDLFSLSEQASRPELDHVPNLAVIEFLQRLRRDTSRIHAAFSNPTDGSDSFVSLAQTSCDFLHWVVDHTLRSKVRSRSGLELVSHVAGSVDQLDIFTLNHDTLIEEELSAHGVGYESGFGDRTHGAFSVYQPGWSKASRKVPTRILKLHGSLNWYLYEFPGWARQYAIPDGDPFRGRDQDGNLVNPAEWKAAFLSGTIVKEQRYGLGFWSELLAAFHEHLSQHRFLIFCGYGFGDPGVNMRIYQWACNLPGDNKLIVLTADDEAKFFSDKPPWMHQLRARGQIQLVDKYLQSCTMSDIEHFFS
ncbi:MAG: SIR2 family protein [Verrucomicrobiota bacterium]